MKPHRWEARALIGVILINVEGVHSVVIHSSVVGVEHFCILRGVDGVQGVLILNDVAPLAHSPLHRDELVDLVPVLTLLCLCLRSGSY